MHIKLALVLFGILLSNSVSSKDSLPPLTPVITKGADYLQKAIANDNTNDKWYGVDTKPPYHSTTNVMTAYFLARALYATGSFSELNSIFIKEILRKAKQSGAYGYASGIPVDADVTAFALRTLILLNQKITLEQLVVSLAPFEYYQHSNSNFPAWTTFENTPNYSLQWTTVHTGDQSVIGLHPEVYLNVLNLFKDQPEAINNQLLDDMFESSQLNSSYHYPSKIYSLWQASDLFRGTQREQQIDREILQTRLSNKIWRGIDDGWSAHQETSLAILSLSQHTIKRSSLQAAIQYIVDNQLPDGSWEGSRLWNYYPLKKNGGGLWYAVDQSNCVATSIALLALTRYRNLMQKLSDKTEPVTAMPLAEQK